MENDIHILALRAADTDETRRQIIRDHYFSHAGAEDRYPRGRSALLRQLSQKQTGLFGIFGGQGNTRSYFAELRAVYLTYQPLVHDLINSACDILKTLSEDIRISDQFPHGLDILKWLEDPDSTPSADDLLAAPVSFPVIGLLQLAQLKAICQALGYAPADFPALFKGLAGHSQGIVVAAAVSAADSWPAFHDAAIKAIRILFWIGTRCQQFYVGPALSQDQVNQLEQDGYGKPSPMLSVTGMPLRELEKCITELNGFLAIEDGVAVSLVNGDSSYVVSGPEQSLRALIAALKNISAKDTQSRIPYSQRKPRPNVRFLPMSIPCHSHLVADAASIIEGDLSDVHVAPQSLRIPVNPKPDGSGLNSMQVTDLVPTFVRLITSEPVSWPDVDFLNATHIIDFGPGGTSGVGALTHRIHVGSGIRVLLASKLDLPEDSDYGSVAELFDYRDKSVRRVPCWSHDHAASLVRTAAGTMVDSKLSRLLGLPPFFVPGMVPTTTHPEFVAAIMNAGYHVELGLGGYHNADSVRGALNNLREWMPEGRGITVNVIYISPAAIAWQIPLIKELRAEGFPITGLTVGGGVPSVDVATEYITTLGLDHISLKPGSVAAIRSCLEIAQRNPMFPLILQWTGGRGGGHHSYEDFHDPILETYAEIRKHDNVILVAGSGFGSADDVHTYLSGEWSLSYGKMTAMPFDGILFGSRVMTCAEARTSPGAKAAIASASGVQAERDWEKTYSGPAGGILTIVSEMGEPIHVVATRGALFWAEMDKMIFKLDKSKRVAVLAANRDYIIKKLNADHQKPWFGCHNGTAAELGDMTYLEVLERMIELMFVQTRKSWIDAGYGRLFLDFVLRTLERLAKEDATEAHFLSEDVCSVDPKKTLRGIKEMAPEVADRPLCLEDVHYFLQLCRRPGQKPVPFVPILDENFETYFKKDSLWQSENTDAVVGQDAGRTLILHGPVAARATCEVDEPVKSVLDGINSGAMEYILRHRYAGVTNAVPYEELLRPAPESRSPAGVKGMRISDLLALLGGELASWRYALFCSTSIARGHCIISNPVRNLVHALDPETVRVDIDDVLGSPESHITLYQQRGDGEDILLEVVRVGKEILVTPFTHVTTSSRPIPLVMRFVYRPETPYAPVHEVLEGRNQRIYDMYRQLWLGQVAPEAKSGGALPDAHVFEDDFIIDKSCVQSFNCAIGYHKAHRTEKVPLDFAVVASWKSISRALLQDPVQGDLLALVHLSNSYEVDQNVIPLEFGLAIRTRAYVNQITIDDSGKTVEVVCELQELSSGAGILTVRSHFLFRGTYTDFSSTFARSVDKFEVKLESESDAAVLSSRPWFRCSVSFAQLNGATLEFHLSSCARYQSKTIYSLIETTGRVYSRSESGQLLPVGEVSYREACCKLNAVTSYLTRKGKALGGQQQPLKGDTPIPTHVADISIPSSNEAYSRASGDFNPIHTSPMFAALVKLPGTITHGMYCSAAVRGVVERHVAGQQPLRIRKYAVSFVGMVLPDDVLEVSLNHVAMQDGMKVIKIDVSKRGSGAKVLSGEALVSQPRTAVLFTGQGGQEKGMGMDLYETSPVARQVWDRADAYFRSQFGLSILDIVRNNPRQLRVHFGGVRGRILRQNYRDMFYESNRADGTTERKPMFPTIGDDTTHFTHSSPNGLLFATQFAQPALTILELAAYKDMQARGVVDPDSLFAGHSLGEYAMLAAISDFMSFEKLLYLVFTRGMTMHLAVDRDPKGRSDYSMVAVNPSLVGKSFNDAALHQLVAAINKHAGFFVEIVNLNIRNSQYVCAGDLRGLDLLQRVLDDSKRSPGATAWDTDAAIVALVMRHAPVYQGVAASSVRLTRGAATIPLTGVDVPFHSSLLRSRMEAFRRVLLATVEQERVRPETLVGRYIPNLTARPFDISKEYIENVAEITGSERLMEVLERWEEWVERVGRERGEMVAVGRDDYIGASGVTTAT